MPDPVDVHVGMQIQIKRKSLGLSQTKLGDAIGLTFQQVQKYEKGANRIGASRLFEISQVLSVPISYFFRGYDPETDNDNGHKFSDISRYDSPEAHEAIVVFENISRPDTRQALKSLSKALSAP
jgi:transcriptional regulator with XRE-family HTH domain